MTSAELQQHADEYAAFVVHPETQQEMPVVDFCHLFVEGMGKEAGQFHHPLPFVEINIALVDHVQMQALAKAMSVNLSVAYLDGTLGGKGEAAVDFVKFENGGGEDVNGLDDVVSEWCCYIGAHLISSTFRNSLALMPTFTGLDITTF